jgi:toxin-antitoxin system PIN domain toxin
VKIVDLNILLYAINRNSTHHAVVRDWWEKAVSDEDPVGLPWAVLLGFLRLSTNPKVFPNPLTPEQAMEIIDTWLSRANVKIVLETDEHWRILRRLLETTGTAGNLTTDAHLASLAISYGAALASCDADFSRFSELRWESPLIGRARSKSKKGGRSAS